MRAHDLEIITRLRAENQALREDLIKVLEALKLLENTPGSPYTCTRCGQPAQPAEAYDEHGPAGYGSGCCAAGLLLNGQLLDQDEIATILADVDSLKDKPNQF